MKSIVWQGGARELSLSCEVCGSPIRGAPSRVEIDGAVLWVCQSCARRGTPITSPPRGVVRLPRAAMRPMVSEPELEVDPDYGSMVKRAREKMGLTQEALGRAMNVKPSVISHIESKKMKPDLVLARALMHHLKVDLLVPSRELEGPS